MNARKELERLIEKSKIIKYIYKIENYFGIEKPKKWKSLYTAILGEDKWIENKIEELTQAILDAGYHKHKRGDKYDR